MPLDKFAMDSQGSKSRRPSNVAEVNRKKKLINYALGILFFTIVAAFLYPMKQAEPPLFCPSSFTHELVRDLQNPNIDCEKSPVQPTCL